MFSLMIHAGFEGSDHYRKYQHNLLSIENRNSDAILNIQFIFVRTSKVTNFKPDRRQIYTS